MFGFWIDHMVDRLFNQLEPFTKNSAHIAEIVQDQDKRFEKLVKSQPPFQINSSLFDDVLNKLKQNLPD